MRVDALGATAGPPHRAALRREAILDENTQIQVLETYERCFSAGQLIFDEGDRGDVLYVVHSGEVELTRVGPSGRSTVARLQPGDFFGEMSVVVGEPRTARAVAVVDSRLLELDGQTLEAMCMDRPEVGLRIIHRLTQRLIEAERRLATLGIDDILRPLVQAIVRRAEPREAGEDGLTVRVPLRLRTLAEEAGLSMFEAHRALHQLLDQKVVRLVDDELLARDVDAVSACVDAVTDAA